MKKKRESFAVSASLEGLDRGSPDRREKC